MPSHHNYDISVNGLTGYEYRYLPLLKRKAEDEDILVRYYSRVLRQLVEASVSDTLQKMAREEACHARKLETVYFLWTGECADVSVGDLPCYRCAAELLRAMHRAKLEAAAAYRQAAEELPEYRCLFLALAEEEMRQAACFFALLQRCIAPGT